MGLFGRLETFFSVELGVAPGLFESALGTATVVFVYLVVQRITRKVLSRSIDDLSLRFQVNKAIAYGLGTIAALVIFKIWVHEVTGLATYLGLLSAGMAIALQDAIANFAGWVYIVVRRPFATGHRIQVGTYIGDVVDIRPFRFVILEIGNWVHAEQSTGRVIHVPNALVFKNPVANYDEAFGYIWNELELVVTFESNWRKAKEVLLRTVTEHSEHLTADVAERIRAAADSLHIKFGKVSPAVWTSLAEYGVRLTTRYLCKPRERRSSASLLWELILDEFARLPDVSMAYPTNRQFDQTKEGKRGA